MKVIEKKRYIIISIVMLLACTALGLRGAETDKEIFDKARLALFDRKWDQALDQLNRLMELYPHTAYSPEVLFYRGKCCEEKKMPHKALENYSAYVKLSQNESLKEQALISMIDLNYTLYEKENHGRYLEDIQWRLEEKNQVVRYYAALILSKAKEKTIAAKAVPILKKIITEENDQDLVDRAKIALMRIDPQHLKKMPGPKNLENRMLVIQAVDKKDRKETFSISIPFVLARLALESLPADGKKVLKDKGYNLDDIIETIARTGEIMRIESEDSIIKIWIK